MPYRDWHSKEELGKPRYYCGVVKNDSNTVEIEKTHSTDHCCSYAFVDVTLPLFMDNFNKHNIKQWTEQWTLCNLTPQLAKHEYPLSYGFSIASCLRLYQIVNPQGMTLPIRYDGNVHQGYGMLKFWRMRMKLWGWGKFHVHGVGMGTI